MTVVTFERFLPPARYDSLPWTKIRIEEGATDLGPWTAIETMDISPVDDNPAQPDYRSFTTENGTAIDLWYRIIFVDATDDESLPTTPIQNLISASHLYLTRVDIKATASVTGSFSDPDIDRALEAACRGLDLATGRRFYPDADATSVRYYTPVSPTSIIMHDLITLGSLETSQRGNNEFDESWTENTQFVLEPLNAELEGKPYTRITLNPHVATEGFPSWAPRSAKLTGRFGWLNCPAGIVEATALLTNRLLQRSRSAPLGVMFNADIAMRIAYSDPDVRDLIKPHVREEII